MRRRDFITIVLGGAAAPAILPPAVRAQQGAVPVVGFLGIGPLGAGKAPLEPSPTGRRGYGEPRFALLSDPHQLEAMKKRGLTGYECVVMRVDETDGRLWQIAELLRQPKLSLLDRAELVMEWVRLVKEKDARVGHPVGGVQPHNKGLSRAGRVLGVSIEFDNMVRAGNGRSDKPLSSDTKNTLLLL